jgi:hypothetical protein
MTSIASTERYHNLDLLRSFAMLLGIVLHAVVSFMTVRSPLWPAHDRSTSPAADVFLVSVHNFRMQLFFLLAGFFACLLYQRYRLSGLVMHRLKRIALPLFLAMLVVQPTVQATLVYGAAVQAKTGQETFGAAQLRQVNPDLMSLTPLEVTVRHFTSGRFLGMLVPIHLWFLYYLLLCLVLLLPVLVVGRWLDGTAVQRAGDAAFRWLVRWPGKPLLLAVPTALLLVLMSFWVVDTPMNWVPVWHLLLYYFAFFLFGWLLYRQRDLLADFGRWWLAWLLVGNLVALPVFLIALGIAFQAGYRPDQPFPEGLGLVRAVGLLAAGLHTWATVVGLMGLFARFFAQPRPWVRWLSDSSYWCYVMSLTPTILLQIWLADVPLPGLLKFAFINAAVLAGLLVSYQYLVRYTWVGALLNGRKVRPTVTGGGPGERRETVSQALPQETMMPS